MKAREARKQKVQFRRKRIGKTNYKQRLRLLKSKKPRFVIRPALKNITCQIIEYSPKGDKILFSIESKNLEKYGWKYSKSNIPAAYLTGFLIGIKAQSKIKDVVADLGLSTLTKGSKIFACIKGLADAGIKIPHSDNNMPSEDRINGSHVAEYAKNISSNKEKYNQQFSQYTKNNLKPEDMPKSFEDVKNKIKAGEQ